MEHSSSVALAATLARAIELAGIAIMVCGGMLALALFAWRTVARSPTPSRATATDGAGESPFEIRYGELRANLGRAILLGLEFLVAADIIGTVAIEPSFRSLGVLALIVGIRTFLSFTLELEITGRWPWQQAPGHPTAPGVQPPTPTPTPDGRPTAP